MGKVDERAVAASSAIEPASGDTRRRACAFHRALTLKCVAYFVFGLTVLLSSIFLLLPFVRFGDGGVLELSPPGAPIEASFKLQKPMSLLSKKSAIVKLENDILEEIGVPDTKVVIISLISDFQANLTNIVFGILPLAQDSKIPTASLSILRSSLVAFVTQQSYLHLTPNVFGVPSFFQVLQFSGGITVAPPQNAFLLQKVQVPFNFALNYSINQIQDNFAALETQLKSGLHLRHYEALYVRLTNLHGSTLSSPVIVQASIFAKIGIVLPHHRLKQLARVITSSPEKNLGLNHTVFGKVQQIQLSTYLQRYFHGYSCYSTTPSPGPHHQRPYHGHHYHPNDSHVPSVSTPPPHPCTDQPQPHYALAPSNLHHLGGSVLGHKGSQSATLEISSFAVQHNHPPASLFNSPGGSPMRSFYLTHVQLPSNDATIPRKNIKGILPAAASEDANPSLLSSPSLPSPSPTLSLATLTISWLLMVGALVMHV